VIQVFENSDNKSLTSSEEKGMRYAVCGMNDKNNSTRPSGTPLFSPEDPEVGFSSGSSGPSRRKFLKRSGGATVGSLIMWHGLAEKARGVVENNESNVSWEYTLRCKKHPMPNDPGNPVGLPDLHISPNANWFVKGTKACDGDTYEVLSLTLDGRGPVAGAVSDRFVFRGTLSADYNDDADDENTGDDQLGIDIQHQVIGASISEEASIEIMKDTSDGSIYCNFDPSDITPADIDVDSSNTNGLTENKSMECTGAITPATTMTALAAILTSSQSHSVGFNAGLANVGVAGASYSLSSEGTTNKVKKTLKWEIEVVRRPKGTLIGGWTHWKDAIEVVRGFSAGPILAPPNE